MSKPLIFLGSSDAITISIDVCHDQEIPIAGIVDSDYYGNTDSFDGIPYIGSENDFNFDKAKLEYDFFIGVNSIPIVPRNVAKRQKFIKLINKYDLPCINLIERQSRIARNNIMGKGVFIGYCASIQSNVTIGDHCQIFAMTAVGHHSVLEENVTLQRMVMVTSHTHIKPNAYIGSCAKLLKFPGMTIGENSFIHPGITVMRDVEADEVVSLTGKNNKKIYDTVVL